MGAVKKKLPEFLSTPTATFREIFNGLFPTDPMNVRTKLEGLPVSEIIGGTQKIWAVPGYAHAPFPTKFLIG